MMTTMITILMMTIPMSTMMPKSISTITINQKLTVLIPMIIQMYSNYQMMLSLNMKKQMIIIIIMKQVY